MHVHTFHSNINWTAKHILESSFSNPHNITAIGLNSSKTVSGNKDKAKYFVLLFRWERKIIYPLSSPSPLSSVSSSYCSPRRLSWLFREQLTKILWMDMSKKRRRRREWRCHRTIILDTYNEIGRKRNEKCLCFNLWYEKQLRWANWDSCKNIQIVRKTNPFSSEIWPKASFFIHDHIAYISL